MPIAKFETPDGGVARFEVPDGTTPEQAMAVAQQYFAQMSKPSEYSAAPDSTVGKIMGALDKVEAAPYIGPVVKGVRDITKGGAQLLAHGINAVAPGILPDDEIKNIDNDVRVSEQKYQDARKVKGEDGVDWGRMIGSGAITYPLAPIKAATVPAAIAKGAATSTAMGAFNPVTSGEDFTKEKAKQMLLAGVGGTAVSGLGAGLSRVIRPNTAPEVKALMNEGVTPTPGQIMGGAIARFEDKLTSVPIIGDAIKTGQRRAIDQFNQAAYNRALEPIGKRAGTDVGREGVEGVKIALSEAYNRVLPKLQFGADDQFSSELSRISGMVDSSLARAKGHHAPPGEADIFDAIVKKQIIGKLTSAGTMSGQTFKQVESELSRLAKGYRGDASFDKRQLGDAINEVLQSMRGSLQRSNPQYADELTKINQGFANYARVRDAAGRVGAQEGVFTPAQLQQAVRAADKSVGKGNFATGNALMQDLSEAGKTVLGSKYPDSGTAGRLMAGPGIGAAIGAMNPMLGLGIGAGLLPYTALGQRAMASLLTKRPDAADPIARGLLSASPMLGTATAGGLLGLYGTSAP